MTPATLCAVTGCTRPRYKRYRICAAHWFRRHRTGDVHAEVPIGWPRPVEGRFWPRLDQSGGPEACWPWTGSRTRTGYGKCSVDGRHVAAHRLAWQLTNGPIPDGLHVLHRCDNPPCCNPGHLFLGTHTDNVRDMLAKGRGRATRAPRPSEVQGAPEALEAVSTSTPDPDEPLRAWQTWRDANIPGGE